jgi:hypothetical protein
VNDLDSDGAMVYGRIMTPNKVTLMLHQAEKQGLKLYAKNLQINSLGLIDSNWRQVLRVKKLYGEVHCMTPHEPRWNKVISPTVFEISKTKEV